MKKCHNYHVSHVVLLEFEDLNLLNFSSCFEMASSTFPLFPIPDRILLYQISSSIPRSLSTVSSC